mmetsp:Transcript_24090/g.56963  ORF Transcript_24090/g.56963 Transcript_24090/m.56963 type:complete len:704 (+) Transcript_24090:1063-3174(+)
MEAPVFARKTPQDGSGGIDSCSSSSSRKRKLRALLKTIPTSSSSVDGSSNKSSSTTVGGRQPTTTATSSNSSSDNPNNNKGDSQKSRSVNTERKPLNRTANLSSYGSCSGSFKRDSIDNSGIDDDDETKALDRKRRLRMEKAAQNAAEELKLDAVRGVTDWSRLGFVKDRKKKGGKNDVVYIPAVVADETSLEVQKLAKLQRQKTSLRNICVQYLGVGYKYANDYEYIASHQWETLSSDGNGTNEEDERRLMTHLNRISSHVNFLDSPLDLKTEEFVVRECWKRVKTEQDGHSQKLPPVSGHCGNGSNLATHVSQDSQGEEDSLNRGDTEPTKDSSKSEGASPGPPSEHRYSESGDESDDDDDDDDDDEDDDGDITASCKSGVSQRRLKQICVGDVIEFTAPNAVAGDERFRIEAKVEGVRSKGPRKGLLMAGTWPPCLTDLSHPVRLLKVRWKCKLVDVSSDSSPMPISSHSLRGGGVQDESKVMQSTIDLQRRMVEEMKKEMSATADQWWEDNADAEEEEPGSNESLSSAESKFGCQQRQTKKNTSDSAVNSSPARKCPRPSTGSLGEPAAESAVQEKDSKEDSGYEKTNMNSETQSWYSEVETTLTERIKIEKENIKAKRRYRPHLSIDQLDLVLKICKHVCKKSLEEQDPVATILGTISDNCGIPDRNLTFLIKGDQDCKLREKQIESHVESLVRWLET